MRSEKLPGAQVWPPVLACGAWLKNTACLLQGDQVLWSPLHGDLGDPQSCLDLAASLDALLACAEVTPQAIVSATYVHNNQDSSLLNLQARYALSKRTSLYGGYSKVTEENAAGVKGGDTKIFAVGVRHDF